MGLPNRLDRTYIYGAAWPGPGWPESYTRPWSRPLGNPILAWEISHGTCWYYYEKTHGGSRISHIGLGNFPWRLLVLLWENPWWLGNISSIERIFPGMINPDQGGNNTCSLVLDGKYQEFFLTVFSLSVCMHAGVEGAKFPFLRF